MYGIRKVAPTWALTLVCVASASFAQQGAEVQRVRVLKAAANQLEIEIETSQPIAPKTQEVSDPTRLVVDFPQAKPGPQLRAVTVNRGDVKGIRVGLFSSQPPTTRVVLDLGGPVNYQVLPSGKSIILKFGAPAVADAAANGASEAVAVPEPPKPKVEVTYNNGQLHILSDRASLADVLNEIHKQTGAEVMVPPGADQEKVFSELGPASPKEVLNSLLTGTSYNFILIGSSENPNSLERVLVSNKGTSMVVDVGGAPMDAQPIAQPIAATGRMTHAVAAAPEPQPEAGSDEMPAQQEPVDTPPPDPQAADPQNGEQPPPPPQN